MIRRVPKKFYDDHVGRDLPAPPVVRATGRHLYIDDAHHDFPELVADAQYYANPWGPDECPDIVRAAKALLKALRDAGTMAGRGDQKGGSR